MPWSISERPSAGIGHLSQCVPERLLMERIGETLGAIRLQRKLSLRDVEERSRLLPRKRGDNSYRISASWLGRLEKRPHGLTVNKLIVLAHIYDVKPEQLLSSIYPESLGRDPPPDETTLLSQESDRRTIGGASSGSMTRRWNLWFQQDLSFKSTPGGARDRRAKSRYGNCSGLSISSKLGIPIIVAGANWTLSGSY